MDKVEKIEQEVQALSPAELAQFRAWFFECDGAEWDRQLPGMQPTPFGRGCCRRYTNNG